MEITRCNTRRSILKSAVAGLGLVAFWLADSLAKRAETIPEFSTRTVSVPLRAGDGIRFFDDAIVVRGDGGKLSVFSNVCTHLGCRITRTESNEIVCPCHGSRFDFRGQVLGGPARHSLTPLTFEVDAAASLLRIQMKK